MPSSGRLPDHVASRLVALMAESTRAQQAHDAATWYSATSRLIRIAEEFVAEDPNFFATLYKDGPHYG